MAEYKEDSMTGPKLKIGGELSPASGISTRDSETGRLARLTHLARPYIELGEATGHNAFLDYGCGDGTVHDHLIREAFRKREAVLFDGFDILFGYAGPVESWRRARLKPNAYDTVFCFDVIEHAEDPRAMLRDIWCVLKPRGNLVITAPCRWWPFETHAAPPWNRLPFFNYGPWRHRLRDKVGRSVTCYTQKKLRHALGDAGFDTAHAAEGYLTAPMDRFPILRPLVRGHHETEIPCFATEVFAVARRLGL